MVLPVIAAVALGIQGAAMLYQAYEQAQARGANQAELNRIRDLIEKVQDPKFDYSQILPEEYAVVAEYSPEIAATISEAVPEKVKAQSQEAIFAKQARLKGLDQLLKVMESGEDPIAVIERERNARRAAAEAGSARQSLERDYARRGQLGGGLQYAGSMAAANDALNRQALADEQALIGREQARRQAAIQAGTLGDQIYDDEVALERMNVDAFNDFNRRMAERAQQQMNLNTGIRNEAQRYNVANRQRVADANVGIRNQRGNIQRDLQQQQFQNQLNKIGLQSRQGQAQMAQNTQSAQDRAAIAKGIADIGSGAAATYYADQRSMADRDWEAAQREKDRQAYGSLTRR